MSIHSLRRRTFGRGVAAVTAGLLAAAVSTLTAAPGAVAAPRPGTQELQAALDAVVAAGGSGISLRVDDGHHTIRLASGAARLDPRVPMRPDARLRVGSITKTFVSTVTLQLVGEGRLSLDDTVERWQPGLIPNGAHITVRQLLNHTSGIFNYTDDEAFIQSALAHPLQAHTPHELVAVATAQPPVFAPGTSWSYSNTNYIVIGLILERVTHRSVSTLLRQRIIRPLRLHDTVYPTRSPNIPGYHAHGYLPPTLSDAFPPPWGGQNRYVDISRYSPTFAGAAGALISNPDDLRGFYRALLSGRLLRPAQLAEMKTMVELDPMYGYGLGLFTIETPCGRIWGHDGGIPGYTTIAWNDESGRRGMVVGLPTEQDEAIAAAFETVLATAVCRVFDRPVPSAAAGVTTAAGVSMLPRIDRGLVAARAG